MKEVQRIGTRIRDSVKKNFWYATLNFLFIILFVNVFQWVFGAENSIVGVVFSIMMSASMVRDLTARPLKHLCIQAVALMLMATAACVVASAPPLVALPVNLCALFLILYAFTYEYVSQLYFPYILSYLFLVFLSPISPAQLPKRLLAMLTGAVCILLYQWVKGRKRIEETASAVLLKMCGKAKGCIECLLSGTGVPQNPEELRRDLCKLSQIVYDRRKKALCISDASFAMIDAGRGLENLVLLLYGLEGPITLERAGMLNGILAQLEAFCAYLSRDAKHIPEVSGGDAGVDNAQYGSFYESLSYIREKLLYMAQPKARGSYRKTLLSLSVRLKAALNVSPVRLAYALRVSCLLALFTLVVQLLHLPHGKWLLFTIASVSLPYAEDVGQKAKKRLLATLLGGVAGVLLYSLSDHAAVRTAVMMLSGYLSFYFSDYTATFALSTVGALGGAVFAGTFGFAPVSGMLLIRLLYILLGIGIALVANCLVFPFRRGRATRQLWRKYRCATELLTELLQGGEIDPQLYYSLVIQSHLLEEKLLQNAKSLPWEGAGEQLAACREAVRRAHRHRTARA